MSQIITESFLHQLIRDKIQENLHLDYKKTDSLNNNEKNKTEISKDVSAFANSDGGVIIYGIIEHKHIPETIEGRKIEEGKREWLEQVINSRIEPRIWGVTITQIDLQDQPGRAVYVVEIPRSFTAHQSFDKRYYRRYNFQSVPMYDYEVKQTINRGREPNLLLRYVEEKRIFLPVKDDQYILPLLLENNGPITAKSIEVYLYIPLMFKISFQGGWEEVEDLFDQRNLYRYIVFRSEWMSDFYPLHPKKQTFISKKNQGLAIALKPNNLVDGRAYTLEGKYEIYAENMTPKMGKILFENRRNWLIITLNENM